MKKNLLLLLLFMTVSLLNAQNYSKGDLLLNADVQVTKFDPYNEISPDNWEGNRFHLSVYHVFLSNKVLALSTGLHGRYFRHQPLLNENYGTFGLALPITAHFNLIKKLDTYAGYRAGYYFDGFNPKSEENGVHYEGLYSEMYLGVKYFIIPRISIYVETTTSDFQVYAGVCFKF